MEIGIFEMIVITVVMLALCWAFLSVLSGGTNMSHYHWFGFVSAMLGVGLLVFHFVAMSLSGFIFGMFLGSVAAFVTIQWYERMLHDHDRSDASYQVVKPGAKVDQADRNRNHFRTPPG